MKVCYTKTHGEIVYEDDDCPACVALEEKDIEIEELKEEIKTLTDKISELEAQK